jgi:hypothetical protein
MDNKRHFGVDIDKTDLGKPDKVSANAARNSSARDYSTNLVPLLKDMHREGLLNIDTEKINFFGENPFNPATIIRWHKAYSSSYRTFIYHFLMALSDAFQSRWYLALPNSILFQTKALIPRRWPYA